MRHAVEVRLASIQASNSALSERLRDAQDVREDLRGQCDDLRMRLSSIEKERQATTVGLLMAQKRILELEAGPRPAPLRAWRRTGTWAMALVCLAVLAMWRDAVHARETLEGEASEGALVLEKSLAAAAAAREDFGEQLARIEAHSRASQAEFETERGLAAELRTRLEARLDEERTNAKALTQRLDSELSRAAQRWDTVQGALEDSRTETARAEAALAGAREAAASEREQRQRAWLAERRQAEERMDELLAEVRETRTEMASLLAQPAAPAQGTRPIARRSFTARMLAAVRSWASSEQSVPD
ncbi:MAG: hypothetical protein GY711_14120 [bacterium]|nr:hypothetical protein [bacterium]